MTPLERLAKQRDAALVAIEARERTRALIESKIRAQEKAIRKKREATLGALAYAAGLHPYPDGTLKNAFLRVAELLAVTPDLGPELPRDACQGHGRDVT